MLQYLNKSRNKVIVNKENLKVWRKFTINGTYEGNFMRLVEKTGLSYTTVKKAIDSGKATAKVIVAINSAAVELSKELEALQQPIA